MKTYATRREFLEGAAAVVAGGSVAGVARAVETNAAEGDLSGKKVFRAGAYAADITPETLPVVVNGSFLERTANRVSDRLHARCLVLDDGTTRLAIAVIDTCVLAQGVVDEIKRRASEATGIPGSHILISATHTHSAPSLAMCLGSRPDEAYVKYLPGRVVEGIAQAVKNLTPARIGWTTIDVPEGTNCRRWITRSDRMGTDPFGEKSVRAMMHPGYQNPNYVGPAGPTDPSMSVIAVQTVAGKPIAVLANYSMHYYGASPLSADYYGAFAERIKQLVGAQNADAAGQQPEFVGIMSQGTSGDLHYHPYHEPKNCWNGLGHYADTMAQKAFAAYKTIDYRDWVPLAAAEKRLTLRRRLCDKDRLVWAEEIVERMDGRAPKNRPEVYAVEQVELHKDPVRTFGLLAFRIGSLALVAIPCEVFGVTGLKIKAQSPIETTVNFELANGYEGYIPPPEQHKLGGYTTWAARSAALEVNAEPKIVDAVLGLLEEVSGKPRRKHTDTHGPYAQAVLKSKPMAFWRMGELRGPVAHDCSGNEHHGRYEDGVAFYLEGPSAESSSGAFCGEGQVNRCPHFAGGRMKTSADGLGESYSVEGWVFSGLPNDARAITGYFFSRGADGDQQAQGDHLGIAGTSGGEPGQLVFYNGNVLRETLFGGPPLSPRTWYHVVLVRDGKKVAVYLDGKVVISGEAQSVSLGGTEQWFVGGRNDGFAGLEGKLDEVALYDRLLTPDEVVAHFHAANLP